MPLFASERSDRVRDRRALRATSAALPRFGRRVSPRHLVTLIICLMTLAWQGLAVETHVDRAQFVSTISATHTPDLTVPSPPHHDNAVCPLCQALTMAGHMVQSGGPVLHDRDVVAYWIVPDTETRLAYHSVSHLWRSRAPPARV